MAHIRLTGVEQEHLRSEPPLKHAGWDRLMRSAAALPSDLFYRTFTGVRAGGYVGVVDLGWCQVELLPKTSESMSDQERRAFLLNLLARSGLVPHPLISGALVRSERESLFEALIGAFAARLHDDLLEGVPRRYHARNERLPLVRGRIRFEALARSLPSEHHLIPVRHAPLQYDNVVTRVLRALVNVLAQEAVSSRVLEALEHCDRMLAAAARMPLRRLRPDRIRLAGHEARWKPHLDLATILRRGQVPIPISHGEADAFGLLFSLHDVFEEVIRRVLGRGRPAGIRLTRRPARPRLLHPIDGGTPILPVKPDLLFEDGTGVPRLVADAKWKVLKSDTGSMGLTPGDLYQVATYMAAHSVGRGLLLFPQTRWMQTEGLPWARRFSLSGAQGELTVGGVDIVGLVSTDTAQRRAATERLEALLSLACQDPGTGASGEVR